MPDLADYGGLLLPFYEDGNRDNAYFMWPPDWDGATVTLARKHVSSVLTSQTGSEQRTCLNTIPRRRIKYQTTTLSPYQSARLERFLKKYMNAVVGVPLWNYEMVISEDVSSGSYTIPVVSANYRELDRIPCVVIGSKEQYEVRNIDSFTDTLITMTELPLSISWTAGTKLYPVIRATIGTDFSLPMIAPHVLQTNEIDFQESFIWDPNGEYFAPAFQPDTPSYSTFKGYYVWERFPTWTTSPEQSMYQAINFTGSAFGYQYMQTYQQQPQWGQQALHSILHPEHIFELANFFDYCGGRLQKFWVPSFQPAFELAQPIGASDVQLVVQEHDIANSAELEEFHRYIYIYRKSGSFCRKLVDAAPPYWLEIEEPLGVDLALADVEQICFLYLVRFDVDELEFEYPAGPNNVAEVTCYYKEVLGGYPE